MFGPEVGREGHKRQQQSIRPGQDIRTRTELWRTQGQEVGLGRT